MPKSRVFSRALKSLGKVPRRNPSPSVTLPKRAVDFAIKHKIRLGSQRVGDDGAVFFVRDPHTLQVVESTRSKSPTVPQIMAMMKRYLRNRVKPNPSSRAKGEAEEAAHRYEAFTGHTPTKEYYYQDRRFKTGLAVGKLAGVMYEATRDGETDRYFHRFKRSSQPLLIASHDGSQLGIVGGRYRFTDRGIVDD